MEKIDWKKCEITFFIKLAYRDQKMGGKNAKKNLKKHTIRVSKIVGKKTSGKSRKTHFIITRIS